VTDKNTETIRPEIPPDLDAVGALLELARAFLPGIDLPSLAGPTEPAGSVAKARVPTAEVRYQMLVEQLPAATFMASFGGATCT
jgi:hypothetical protein